MQLHKFELPANRSLVFMYLHERLILYEAKFGSLHSRSIIIGWIRLSGSFLHLGFTMVGVPTPRDLPVTAYCMWYIRRSKFCFESIK